MDAAFIPFSDQNAWLKTCQVKRQTGTSGLPATSNISSELVASSIYEGMPIKKYGISSGVKTGSVVITSVDTGVDGKVIFDTVKMSVNTLGGDSGGPVLTSTSNALMGITIRRSTDNLYGYAIKSPKITSMLGLVPLTTGNGYCDCH